MGIQGIERCTFVSMIGDCAIRKLAFNKNVQGNDLFIYCGYTTLGVVNLFCYNS